MSISNSSVEINNYANSNNNLTSSNSDFVVITNKAKSDAKIPQATSPNIATAQNQQLNSAAFYQVSQNPKDDLVMSFKQIILSQRMCDQLIKKENAFANKFGFSDEDKKYFLDKIIKDNDEVVLHRYGAYLLNEKGYQYDDLPEELRAKLIKNSISDYSPPNLKQAMVSHQACDELLSIKNSFYKGYFSTKEEQKELETIIFKDISATLRYLYNIYKNNPMDLFEINLPPEVAKYKEQIITALDDIINN